ncbi:hypothetical protein MmiHf6_10050 [Methanimicrococcus hongohii]|uniref:Uncharacterized protein n=1 Tax=Methanimicrococcus hongohii TaxID=3028295 RepID=A0AA96ZUE5_9EURY|nr:hypothetical protein [Methanimicrococcus sp. Hf6]WNY23692.1 hypothetical protein MmiHf6_10050 [Methanimicrococcus sp. Hf6]
MWYESFDEIFTYTGEAPEPTPEEMKKRKQTLKEGHEDIERQIQRIEMGFKLDGTRYKEGEIYLFRK